MKKLNKKTAAIVSIILILTLIMTCFCSCKKKTVEEETTIIVDENDDDIVDIDDEDKDTDEDKDDEDTDDGEEIDDGEEEEPEEETYWNNSYYKITKTGVYKDGWGYTHIIHKLEAKQTGYVKGTIELCIEGEEPSSEITKATIMGDISEYESELYLIEGETDFFEYVFKNEYYIGIGGVIIKNVDPNDETSFLIRNYDLDLCKFSY